MKKILFFLVLLLNTHVVSATTFVGDNVKSLISAFRHCPKADYTHVSKPLMFLAKAILKKADCKDDEDLSILKMINSVKVVDLEECSDKVKTNFYERAKSLKTKGYKEIVRSNTDGELSIVMVKSKNDIIREIVVIDAEKNDGSIVKIKGKVPLKALQSVIENQTKKYKHKRSR